jgi:hypothetical protein
MIAMSAAEGGALTLSASMGMGITLSKTNSSPGAVTGSMAGSIKTVVTGCTSNKIVIPEISLVLHLTKAY